MRKHLNPIDNLKEIVNTGEDDTKVSSIQKALDVEVCPLGGKQREMERRYLSGEISLDEYLEFVRSPYGGQL